MDKSDKNEEMNKETQDIRLTKKDIIAIMIAQFEILMPITLVFFLGFILIILFLMKVWLKV